MRAMTSKDLIFNLFLADNESCLNTREVMEASALFGIQANSARVALTRLSSAGLIETQERGSYRLGSQAASLADELGSWKKISARLTSWQQDWVMVLTVNLGRTDRSALTTRQRALHMTGFRELERGVHLRPNNLVGGASLLRERLIKLGLEQEAPVMLASQLGDGLDGLARNLWDRKQLESGYHQMHKRIEQWLLNWQALDIEVAAREVFVLGNAAIRHMIYDPLLPEQLVDTSARDQCLAAVFALDTVGHDIWKKLRVTLAQQSEA